MKIACLKYPITWRGFSIDTRFFLKAIKVTKAKIG